MSTAQLLPASRILAPADVLDFGGSHSTEEKDYYLLSDDPENSGTASWHLFIEPRDLVINKDQSKSAHVLKVDTEVSQNLFGTDGDALKLDNDIISAVDTSESYRIVRGADWRVLPPEGLNLEFYSVQGREPRSVSHQGVELFVYNLQTRRWSMLEQGDDNGRFDLDGRNLQANWLESLLLTNFTEHNVLVRMDGIDMTIGDDLF